MATKTEEAPAKPEVTTEVTKPLTFEQQPSPRSLRGAPKLVISEEPVELPADVAKDAPVAPVLHPRTIAEMEAGKKSIAR